MSIVNWKKNNGMFPTLNSFFSDFLNDGNGFIGNWSETEKLPAVNVKEVDGGYDLELAAPGMKKEDFKIELDKGVLTISAKKETSEEESSDNFTRKEFSYNSFCRSFWLPENITEENIKAEYKNGLLILNIPKLEPKEEAKKKQIEIS